jgi:TRAP-type C4-dicarboxylate transport system permease small subunit
MQPAPSDAALGEKGVLSVFGRVAAGAARVDRGLAWVERAVGSVILCCLIAVLSTQVASRQIPGLNAPWTEELSRIFFAWLAFIGIALAFQQRAHIAITVLVDRSGRTFGRIVDVAICLMVMLFGLVLVSYGLRLCLSTRMVSTVLQIPMWVPYSMIPISGALMTFHAIVGLMGVSQERQGIGLSQEGS